MTEIQIIVLSMLGVSRCVGPSLGICIFSSQNVGQAMLFYRSPPRFPPTTILIVSTRVEYLSKCDVVVATMYNSHIAIGGTPAFTTTRSFHRYAKAYHALFVFPSNTSTPYIVVTLRRCIRSESHSSTPLFCGKIDTRSTLGYDTAPGPSRLAPTSQLQELVLRETTTATR